MIKIKHNAGFFSCCSVRLDKIINYYNKNRCLPERVNSRKQFKWYKPVGKEEKDITYNYFEKNNKMEIQYIENVK